MKARGPALAGGCGPSVAHVSRLIRALEAGAKAGVGVEE